MNTPGAGADGVIVSLFSELSKLKDEEISAASIKAQFEKQLLTERTLKTQVRPQSANAPLNFVLIAVTCHLWLSRAVAVLIALPVFRQFLVDSSPVRRDFLWPTLSCSFFLFANSLRRVRCSERAHVTIDTLCQLPQLDLCQNMWVLVLFSVVGQSTF